MLLRVKVIRISLLFYSIEIDSYKWRSMLVIVKTDDEISLANTYIAKEEAIFFLKIANLKSSSPWTNYQYTVGTKVATCYFLITYKWAQ
jgi:hypothetical protein